jgi:hypothetical protein
MADIIVRQANSTSLTVQSSSNQVLVRQQPSNTVVVQTTGNSYVLPPATANTLGGIIVGDNLTINANGLLSATAGAGVSTFNNRTGNVTLTANDVYSAAFDVSKAGTPQLYVRTSNIAPGLSNDLANTPNGTQQSLYSIRSAYPNAPLYSNGTIWSFGSVNIKTTTATNANAAASDVGVFEVIFQVTSNLPVFAGTTNKRSGFQLVYRSGSPWLNILGGVAYDSFININSYPDTYILTKGQAKLYFLTRDVADTLYEPLKRIEPPLELP